MLYNLEKKEKGVIDAKVKFDGAEWEQALNKAYEKNKGKFNIPGFRKGHAPRNIIEKTYGAGAFMNEALDEIYYMAYTSILKENEDIQPIDAPKLEINKMDENGIEMTLSIQCVPEFTLAQYKGLKFTKQEVKVEQEVVEPEQMTIVETIEEQEKPVEVKKERELPAFMRKLFKK